MPELWQKHKSNLTACARAARKHAACNLIRMRSVELYRVDHNCPQIVFAQQFVCACVHTCWES